MSTIGVDGIVGHKTLWDIAARSQQTDFGGQFSAWIVFTAMTDALQLESGLTIATIDMQLKESTSHPIRLLSITILVSVIQVTLLI